MKDINIDIKQLYYENLGRNLIKEIYKFLHNEYILTFEEMKIEKDKLEKYLIDYYFVNIDESKYEIYLKAIKNTIEDENENLDIDFIYKVLDNINLISEIDEDLYSKKKEFIDNYLVYI